MTDYDSIWRMQDEIRTVVNAVLCECIWDLRYNDRRMAIELELSPGLWKDWQAAERPYLSLYGATRHP